MVSAGIDNLTMCTRTWETLVIVSTDAQGINDPNGKVHQN